MVWHETEPLVPYGDGVCFGATEPTTGKELWCYNPLGGGVFLVDDIVSGSAGSNPENLFVHNFKVYFSAISSVGYELFRSDGTQSGTEIYVDFNPGSLDPS